MPDELTLAITGASPGHYAQQIARGALDYLASHGRWRIQGFTGWGFEPLGQRFRGDGMIVVGGGWLRPSARRTIPTVVVTIGGDSGDHRVTVDNLAIGRLAAEHLLARGFGRFGCVGVPSHAFSVLRRKAFADELARRDLPLEFCDMETMEIETRPHWRRVAARLRRFLQGLSLPAAIFADRDWWAVRVLAVAKDLGIAVPEQLAILGVDNDDLVCDLAHPGLSSIDTNAVRVGYMAAERVAALIAGESIAPETILVEPNGVVVRRSTDVTHVEQEHVRRAMALIGEDPALGGVEALAGAVGVSRSKLEKDFRAAIGRSPAAEIRRNRRRRAQRLLRETELPMSRVAAVCGYPDQTRLALDFRRALDTTPTDYRRRHRRGSG
jgi:LacI family transcriptional regulator